jgi:hypothetical protein
LAQDGWQSETATPLTSALKPPTALDGPQDQPESASPYGGIASALKSIAGGQQKQGQKVAGGVAMAVPKMDGRAMTLQQPRQQFDASRFYSMLPRGRQAWTFGSQVWPRWSGMCSRWRARAWVSSLPFEFVHVLKASIDQFIRADDTSLFEIQAHATK